MLARIRRKVTLELSSRSRIITRNKAIHSNLNPDPKPAYTVCKDKEEGYFGVIFEIKEYDCE